MATAAAAVPTSVPTPRNPNPNPNPPSSSTRRPSLRNPLRLLSKRFAAATTQFQQRASHQPPPPPQQPPHHPQPHVTHEHAPQVTHPHPHHRHPHPHPPPQIPHDVHVRSVIHAPPPHQPQPTAAAAAPFAATSVVNRMPADVRQAPVVSSAAAYSNYNANLVIGSHFLSPTHTRLLWDVARQCVCVCLV